MNEDISLEQLQLLLAEVSIEDLLMVSEMLDIDIKELIELMEVK